MNKPIDDDDDKDDLTDDERRALHEALLESWKSVKAGHVRPAFEVLEEIRRQRKDRQ